MDQVLLVSVLLIFVTALFSNVLRQRKRDRVLKDLREFHVTIEMKDGKQVWGRMQVFSNGMELAFTDPYRKSSGEYIKSYILHQDDFDDVRLFYRYHTELSAKNRQRRRREVEKTIHPSLFSRLRRSMRNFLNAFNDAINEALGVFLNRLKGHGGPQLLTTQDQYLKKVSASALGMVGNVFDPILERHINSRVVVVVGEDDKEEEFCGFLKEYSPAWLSLLDCRIKRKYALRIRDVKRMSLQRDLDLELTISEEDGRIVLDFFLSYFGASPLKLIGIKGRLKNAGYYRKLGRILLNNSRLSFRIDDLPEQYLASIDSAQLPLQLSMLGDEREAAADEDDSAVYQTLLPDLELLLYRERVADVYIPRSLGVVRNAAESAE